MSKYWPGLFYEDALVDAEDRIQTERILLVNCSPFRWYYTNSMMYSITFKLAFICSSAFFIHSTLSFNDFPSLMTANATMVVVIEKTFYERKVLARETTVTTREAYDKSVANFVSAVTKMARERMNISGLSIHAFQDTEVNLARDYTILLSVASCRTTWDLFRRAKTEKLVHLAINDIDCPRLPIDEGVSIPLMDPGEELPQLFYDIRMAEKLRWNRAVIIHDDAFGSDAIGKVIQAFSDESSDSTTNLGSTSLFSITRGSSEKITKQRIGQLLASLPPRQPIDDHFIIFVGHETILHIIEAARALGMIHPASQWFFVVPDIAKFSHGNITFLIEYLSEGENIAFLYNETNQNLRRDSSCHDGAVCHARELIGALGIALEKALLAEIQLYEHVTEEEYDATGIDKFTRSRIIITHLRDELYNDSKPFGDRGSTCGRCIRWVVASAITWGNHIGPTEENEPHELRQTGVWTPDPGFEFTDYIFPHIAHGFLGKTLPVATYHNPPWHFFTTNPEISVESHNTKTNKWDGFVFDILGELAENLNFSIKTIVVDSSPELLLIKNDPMRASMSASERIPEAITELVRAKDVFLAACAYPAGMYAKQSGINLTQSITVQTYGLLSAKPKPISRALLFASPYSNEAWACLALAIIVVGPILYAVHTFSPRRADYESNHPHSLVLLGLGSPSRCMWYIYGALLQQGGMHLPKTDGARLIVGTWWLVVMVIVATYSGSLVAFLTFPRMEPAVETVDDLLERSEEFSWTIPAGSFIEDFLLVSSTEGLIGYKQLLQENKGNAGKHDNVTYDENVEKVKDGKHVVIDWASSLKISSRNEHLNTGECYFSLGDDVLLLSESISMALPSGSPYLKIVNTQIQRMHEAGLMNKWIERWMPIKDQCSTAGAVNRETDNHKVNLHDMQGIFFVLFLGYIIGTSFLGWEFWKHKRKIMKERKLIRPFLD